MAESSTRHAPAGVDRLSALPDALLHTVMSFLTTRHAVQTSLLSRRWRELRRTMPCLDIDGREYNSVRRKIACGRSGRDTGWWKLENFASNLLLFHAAPALDWFRLRVRGGSSHQVELERWIRRGIKYNPAVLEVTLLTSAMCMIKLPSLGPSTATAACRLRRLRLHGVSLDAGFADHIRTRCPLLEDLELKRCERCFQELVSATLKSLVIDSCGSGRFSRQQLVVTAPVLASIRLAFVGCIRLFVLNGAAGSLLHASIGECFQDRKLCTLLGSMPNVRTLEFWGLLGYKELLKDEKKVFPKFHNLTTLLLGQCNMREEFGILRFILENAPTLEKVTLHHCTDLPLQYRKLISFESQELNRIDIKYQDGNTANLFGLLMSIRTKLGKNTVTLRKVKCSLKIRIRLKKRMLGETEAEEWNVLQNKLTEFGMGLIDLQEQDDNEDSNLQKWWILLQKEEKNKMDMLLMRMQHWECEFDPWPVSVSDIGIM
ncbi:hypothetical protein EJB05_37844, partial [Eragrostis curvula]